MTATVTKAFKTLNRKFAAGDVVTAADIHPENVLSFDQLVAQGFIKGSDAPESKSSAKPANIPPADSDKA